MGVYSVCVQCMGVYSVSEGGAWVCIGLGFRVTRRVHGVHSTSEGCMGVCVDVCVCTFMCLCRC